MSRPIILLPGETQQDALERRVRFHQFLMPGGIALGVDAEGSTVYSPPITVTFHPVCPWHGLDCNAWDEIKAGRIFPVEDTKLGIVELREMTDDERIANRVVAEREGYQYPTRSTPKRRPKATREGLSEALGVDQSDEIEIEGDEEDDE